VNVINVKAGAEYPQTTDGSEDVERAPSGIYILIV